MTKRDIEGLMLGDQLRVKQGYGMAGVVVKFAGHIGKKNVGGRVVRFIEVIQDGQRRVASTDQFAILK